RDVKPVAKALIARFGSLNGVLNASVAELEGVDGISEITATAIKIIRAAGLRMLKQDIATRPIRGSWQRLLDYLHASMAHEKKEHFRLLFLNKKNELIADEVQLSGT